MDNAARHPAKLALKFEGEIYTYARLRERAARMAAALVGWGLEAGERVALFLENCPDFVAAYLSVGLAGGVVVPVNTQYRRLELAHILGDAGVCLALTDPERQLELEGVRGELPALRSILTTSPDLEAFLAQASINPTPRLPGGDDLAVIAYTSGTTGRSKGAMLRHRNLISNCRAVCTTWAWTEADRLLLTLPLFHTHGLMVGIHGTLVSGAGAELHRHFEVGPVYRSLLAEAAPVTMFFGVPTMYTRLLAYAQTQADRPPPLRLYVAGSAPLSAATFAEFESVFGQKILERYGMTETIMNLTNPYAGERRPGTVGKPFPGQEARVVDVRTRQLLGSGQTGEIEVRGPHVFQGYWQQPAATAESFDVEGWFRTGDLGEVSPDGYYTISGRAKELIITGGYNVYPREVEEVLQQYPGVGEVAVLGLPDPDLGEKVVAAVVPSSPDLSVEGLIAFCRDNLASYKKPRRVVLVEALPRNALGKIQKHLLKEELSTRP